jgi:MYXO-CTERM domain-containing protein
MVAQMRRALPFAGLLALALAGVGEAEAGNSVHPRTPVLWPDAPCIHTIDRSASSSFAFAYAIPHEDTQLTIDELDDSRTHPFFAFCRQWPAGSPPPNYVTLADLQRAIDKGNELDATKLDDPEATLETSPTWAGCWTRVTADDARRPITFAAAAEPVVWDASTVATGTWAIAGYTWEPPYNLWRRAPWVVRVIEGSETAEQLQPAAALGDAPELLSEDEPTALPLCLAADAGASVRLAWASSDEQPPQWHEGEAIPSEGGTMLALPFAAPPEAWGLTLILRARVEAAGGEYSSYPLGSLVVIKPGGPDPSDESGSDTGESTAGESDESSSEGASEATLGESSEGAPPAADSGAACACTSTRAPAGASALGLLVLVALRRRR